MHNTGTHDAPTESRLLAKLLRVLLARERFATLSCLTEALKVECARLRIRWTNDAISDAYRVIASNTPLPDVERIKPIAPIKPIERIAPLSRAEASAVLARLYAGLARYERGGRDGAI